MILDIVYNFLKDKGASTFEDVFSHVCLLLESKWKRNFGDMLSLDKILAKKRGELFGYLSTDGRFIMLSDKRWALTHNFSYDKIRKIRATIVHNNEL